MQNDYYWDDEWSPRDSDESRARGGFWIAVFLLLSLLACVAAAVLVPGGLGFLAGYAQLQAQNHENAIQHFQRGLGYLAENYPELAYTEFEIAVKYDATYEPAQQKLRELQTTFGGRGTPGPPEEDRVAAALFDEARDLISKKEWGDAINRLEQLRSLKADYRAPEVTDLLYQAYFEGGKAAVAEGQIELARERFDAALVIRGGDVEVQRQRDLAVLYLDGQQAVGYNWQTAVQKFSALYQQDPNYDDVKKRLAEAHAQYGDLAAKQNAWCLAAREYDGALALTNDTQLASKRNQAMSLCRQAIVATPTTTPVPGTEIYIAKISTVASKPCTGSGDVSGGVRDALGQPLAGAQVAYYADGINRVTTRTNASGQYQFVWGGDARLFHIIVLSADGRTPAGIAADVQYPGGNSPGCHIVVDWQKVQ
jgi:tetratricopeptide (TPR) repeat protein